MALGGGRSGACPVQILIVANRGKGEVHAKLHGPTLQPWRSNRFCASRAARTRVDRCVGSLQGGWGLGRNPSAQRGLAGAEERRGLRGNARCPLFLVGALAAGAGSRRSPAGKPSGRGGGWPAGSFSVVFGPGPEDLLAAAVSAWSNPRPSSLGASTRLPSSVQRPTQFEWLKCIGILWCSNLACSLPGSRSRPPAPPHQAGVRTEAVVPRLDRPSGTFLE